MTLQQHTDPPRVLPMGDRAVLAEYDSLGAALAGYRGLAASAPVAVVDLVPAARTVLVRFDHRAMTVRAATAWITATEPRDADAADAPTVVLPTRYGGEDLAEAADALGLSPEALVARHRAVAWTSAFIGFAPGFAYLVPDEPLGSDPGAEVPRRTTSRPRVPAGSVALAAAFTGVYPRESPGGWQLIGTTDAVLWDAAADPPALLAPGTRVRFEEVAR